MLFGQKFNLAALLSIAALLSQAPVASCTPDWDSITAYERGYTDGVRDSHSNLHRRSYYEDDAPYYRRAPQAAVDNLFERSDPLFERNGPLTAGNCQANYNIVSTAVVTTESQLKKAVDIAAKAQKDYDAKPTAANKKELTEAQGTAVLVQRSLGTAKNNLREVVSGCREIFKLQKKPLLWWMK